MAIVVEAVKEHFQLISLVLSCGAATRSRSERVGAQGLRRGEGALVADGGSKVDVIEDILVGMAVPNKIVTKHFESDWNVPVGVGIHVISVGIVVLDRYVVPSV